MEVKQSKIERKQIEDETKQLKMATEQIDIEFKQKEMETKQKFMEMNHNEIKWEQKIIHTKQKDVDKTLNNLQFEVNKGGYSQPIKCRYLCNQINIGIGSLDRSNTRCHLLSEYGQMVMRHLVMDISV